MSSPILNVKNNSSMQRNSTLFSRMQDHVEFGTSYLDGTIGKEVVMQNVSASKKAKRWLKIERYTTVVAICVVGIVATYFFSKLGMFGD